MLRKAPIVTEIKYNAILLVYLPFNFRVKH